MVKALKDKKSLLTDAIGDLVVGLVKRIKKDLGIKSPSRVAEGLMHRFTEGAAKGLGNTTAIERAASDISSRVTELAKANPSLDLLVNLRDSEAKAQLAKLQSAQIDVTGRQLAASKASVVYGGTQSQYSGPQSVTNNSREINSPVNVTIHSPKVDAASILKLQSRHIARKVG